MSAELKKQLFEAYAATMTAVEEDDIELQTAADETREEFIGAKDKGVIAGATYLRGLYENIAQGQTPPDYFDSVYNSLSDRELVDGVSRALNLPTAVGSNPAVKPPTPVATKSRTQPSVRTGGSTPVKSQGSTPGGTPSKTVTSSSADVPGASKDKIPKSVTKTLRDMGLSNDQIRKYFTYVNLKEVSSVKGLSARDKVTGEAERKKRKKQMYIDNYQFKINVTSADGSIKQRNITKKVIEILTKEIEKYEAVSVFCQVEFARKGKDAVLIAVVGSGERKIITHDAYKKLKQHLKLKKEMRKNMIKASRMAIRTTEAQKVVRLTNEAKTWLNTDPAFSSLRDNLPGRKFSGNIVDNHLTSLIFASMTKDPKSKGKSNQLYFPSAAFKKFLNSSSVFLKRKSENNQMKYVSNESGISVFKAAGLTQIASINKDYFQALKQLMFARDSEGKKETGILNETEREAIENYTVEIKIGKEQQREILRKEEKESKKITNDKKRQQVISGNSNRV